MGVVMIGTALAINLIAEAGVCKLQPPFAARALTTWHRFHRKWAARQPAWAASTPGAATARAVAT
ncbi:hypothetical protein XAC3810_290052 [Xanthomonas citri pv. citri]|uniref:Uncharacterized protein n=1 Tax=Xanthomonas citri pv. citri TaxID=611301 RepID=A0A0U5FG77_XANCI|nr:hypothetical protein XAC9322_320005 [Xanthomonas citri pv. citri]CEE23885.1 hypothetical protein XAC3824_360004 [Xanthomonas citri pv. citri]CEE25497.1 hypothetical protein XAC1083_310004 [Xanthomonas citri pv. citri]CEE33877.1 hypothetical protein XAC3810_290052 [Xanthomonas citri pv. citri]CEE36514.1 hypothetical protein XAC902_430003 [Xanthomonas citri pv. citri]